MAHDSVRIPPDSTGKRIHHKSFVDGATTYYNPVITLGDPVHPDYFMVCPLRKIG